MAKFGAEHLRTTHKKFLNMLLAGDGRRHVSSARRWIRSIETVRVTADVSHRGEES